MSGGQQQRVALARALVGDADLILFDEPLSNVDAKVREQLRVELLSMQRELGFAAIYVTHDQAEAMELAHTVAVMREGQIAQSGPPQEIYLEPASRYVADFVGSSNELHGTLRTLDRSVAVVETDLGEVRGVPADGLASGSRVVVICRPERTRLAREEPQSPNRWPAEVRASAFLGPNLEHVVHVGDHTFRVWSVDTRLLDAGAQGWLYVEPEHVRVLPR
jgi:iron(III) transport system ATP-binding protein